MQLVKIPYAPLPILSVSAEAEDERNSLAQDALAIQSIATAGDNERARNVAVEIRKHIADVSAARLSLSRPLDQAKAGLIALERGHCAPIQTELNRLERLAVVWLGAEAARVKREEEALRDLLKTATDSEAMELINQPLPEVARAQGQTMRQVMKWICTDVHALYMSKPACVRLEPNAPEIQSCCTPEMPTPGLDCWWENKATFSTR